MTVDNIDVEATIKKVQGLLAQEPNLSPALSSTLDVLLLVVQLLANRLGLNSRNSSKPPSTDFAKGDKKTKDGTKKPGGQLGRVGTTLSKVGDPDEIKLLEVDLASLPPAQYRDIGFDSRQVFDIDIQRIVTEYRSQILEDEKGNRFTAPFPPEVTKAVQYGNGVKVQAVYLSQFQLLPYQRVQDYFQEQIGLPISTGSLFNFNQQAFDLLAEFEQKLITKLIASRLLHTDETGINVGGKRQWLHCASTDRLTLFYAHTKRGSEAMDAKGVLPLFEGILCHDHWKPYYYYTRCLHSLCNAHHLRELERAYQQDGQQWAKAMQDLLLEILADVKAQDTNALSAEKAQHYTECYRNLLKQAEIECPPPDGPRPPGQRGRAKRSKARNLLERLQLFELDVLRFMVNPIVPFTNNQGENDIRMTKVHQKISGCFRSQEGADIFCRVRSYLSTCRKNHVSATQALTLLFDGVLPDFML